MNAFNMNAFGTVLLPQQSCVRAPLFYCFLCRSRELFPQETAQLNGFVQLLAAPAVTEAEPSVLALFVTFSMTILPSRQPARDIMVKNVSTSTLNCRSFFSANSLNAHASEYVNNDSSASAPSSNSAAVQECMHILIFCNEKMSSNM